MKLVHYAAVAVLAVALAAGAYVGLGSAPTAPKVGYTLLDGTPADTGQFRGKVVLVNFWATWCPPCVTEVPDLVRLQTKYEGRLVVVGVADDHGAVDVVQNFASAKQVHYPLVMNTPALAASFPGLIGLPTTYVIDQGGRIVKKHIGQLRIDGVEAEVDALLAGRVEPR